MGTLEKVMELQKQGKSDAEISSELQRAGVSPKEISEAMGQAKIKSAVSQEDSQEDEKQTEQPQTIDSFEGMKQSIMQSPQASQPPVQEDNLNDSSQSQAFVSQNQNPQQDFMNNPQQMQASQNPQPQQQFPQYSDYQQESSQGYQQNYPQQYDQYYSQQLDTDTITEIAEQVVLEKFEEFTKKTGDIASFKNSIQDEVKDLDRRLDRMEDSIEKLQQAIIQKIGEYGANTENIHKDLENMHSTMSKMMNPLMDNYNELKKIADKK